MIRARFLSRHAHNPAAAASIAKEVSNRRRQMRAKLGAALFVPQQYRVFAEDRRELRSVFKRDRCLKRAGSSEADKHSHIHAWQSFGQTRRLRLKTKSR